MKKFILQLVIVCLLGVIIYGLFTYKQGYSSGKDKQYQATIDSLQIEISKKDSSISTLDSTRKILDSLILIDKAKLADIAKKAQQYKNQYEKERDRLNDMSDDDIIRTFTTTFK
jgi:hypothetical protein